MQKRKSRKRKGILLLSAVILLVAFVSVTAYKLTTKAGLKREIESHLVSIPDIGKFYVGTQNATLQDAYIAHGCGIGEFALTNTVEAVQDSLQRNFRFIEMDMLVTTDKHIVGGHDWKTLKEFLGLPALDESPLPYDAIKDLKVQGRFTLLEGGKIAEVMRGNPDLILVTDKIRDYDLLLSIVPFPERMIVEVFSIEDYAAALRKGIKYPAFCLNGPEDVPFVDEYRIPIVTMNAKRFFNDYATREIVQRLHDKGVTILLYHADKCPGGEASSRNFPGKSVSKIYSNETTP